MSLLFGQGALGAVLQTLGIFHPLGNPFTLDTLSDLSFTTPHFDITPFKNISVG